jgi:hypothetical protein
MSIQRRRRCHIVVCAEPTFLATRNRLPGGGAPTVDNESSGTAMTRIQPEYRLVIDGRLTRSEP